MCSDGLDDTDARVVCRQLGFSGGNKIDAHRRDPHGSGQIWLEGVSCNGTEENLTQCNHNGWGMISKCYPRESMRAEYAVKVKRHNVCIRHVAIDNGFKQTERTIFLCVISMRKI